MGASLCTVLCIIMIMRNVSINASPIKAEIRNWYTFDGPPGEVVHNAKYLFAWRDGILIGTYNTFGEATTSLASGKGSKTTTVRQSAQMTKEWNLAALKKLYPHLDLDAEFCDASAWCMLHNRLLTNAFFLNWITKCDEKFAGTITFQPIKKEKWPAPAGRC
jgi:hypothetical protein